MMPYTHVSPLIKICGSTCLATDSQLLSRTPAPRPGGSMAFYRVTPLQKLASAEEASFELSLANREGKAQLTQLRVIWQ